MQCFISTVQKNENNPSRTPVSGITKKIQILEVKLR